MKPSLGRMVHFVDQELTHHAAIIIKVWADNCVNLQVFTSSGAIECRTSVLLNEAKDAGFTWHWPERE